MTSRIFILTIVSVALVGRVDAAEPKPGEFESEKLKVGEKNREYRLVVPKSVDLTKPTPLVIAFHGILIDSKDLMPKYSKLNDTADKHKFILAYPNAINASWGLYPKKVKADLEFFDALVKELSDRYKIDPNRIYVIGKSNGAYFAHLVARERSRTVAAAASHSGLLGLQTLGGIKADRKFPVIIVHGDKDEIFPVGLARENRDKYMKEGHTVRLVELPGQGHLAWTAPKVDINDVIWKFFVDNPLNDKK